MVIETKAVFLSQLLLETHRSDVWRLLGDTYALHQRLLMAFPEKSDGGSGRVLFRVESGKGDTRILVQSPAKSEDRTFTPPDWSRLRDILSGAAPEPKTLTLWRDDGTLIFSAGQRLRFRLRANPAFRAANDVPATPPEGRSPGRQPLVKGRRYVHETRAAQGEWLARKGRENGFELPLLPDGDDWLDAFEDEPEKKADESPFDIRITASPSPSWGWKPNTNGIKPRQPNVTHFGVDYDGILRVTDPAAFASAVAGGIGPAKGFGFGLLSLARA